MKPKQPKQITSKQHIYSRSGLCRFAGPNGRLHVFDVQKMQAQRRGANADIFIVNRAWDQRSESGKIIAIIESQFGITVSDILAGRVTTLDRKASTTISSMFSLWRIRHHRGLNPLPDLFIGAPERVVTNEAMDEGEHYGVISIAPDGTIPGRMIAGPLIQQDLEQQIQIMTGIRWGIVRAREGEFVLPDTFGDYMVMPISPTCCLVADEDDGTVDVGGLSEINTLAQANAKLFLAARDLTSCVGLKICLSP